MVLNPAAVPVAILNSLVSKSPKMEEEMEDCGLFRVDVVGGGGKGAERVRGIRSCGVDESEKGARKVGEQARMYS